MTYDGDAAYALLTPDASVVHYVFDVSIGGACVSTGLLSWSEPEAHKEHCTLNYPMGEVPNLNRYGSDRCFPMLYMYVYCVCA